MRTLLRRVRGLLGMGVYGFVSGVGFAKLLWFGECRKTLGQISLRRVVLW